MKLGKLKVQIAKVLLLARVNNRVRFFVIVPPGGDKCLIPSLTTVNSFKLNYVNKTLIYAHLSLSDLLASFSTVTWVTPSSKIFLATRFPPAFTVEPEKKQNSLIILKGAARDGLLLQTQRMHSPVYIHTNMRETRVYTRAADNIAVCILATRWRQFAYTVLKI